MIFSVLTRSIVLVSAGAAALIVADAGAPAIPSLPVVCAVAMGAAVLASRISLRAALWIVLPAIYVTPAVFLLIKGHDHYAYRVVWMSALLGVIGSRGAAAPWNVPARWRWPLVTWATIIGLSWPLIAWRALDYTWPFVWDDKLPVVPGFSGPAAVAWIGYAAMAQLLGLLWIDWLYRTFGSVDDRFRRDVVAPLAVAIVLACVVGLYQVVVDAGFLSGHAWPRLHRAAGTLMDGNVFGMLSALWAPIFLVLILERSLGVAVGGSGFFLSWLGTWASGSRTALLTALIGSAVAAIHVPRRLRAAVGAAQWRVVAVVLVVGLVAAVALGPALSRSALERTRELLPSTSWASVQKTARALWERDGYGQAAVAMIREYPLSGVGPGAFYYLVHHYALAGTGHTLAGDNAQNWYRHQIAELGFIGSLGWLVWIAVVVFQVWPRRGRATGPGVLLRGPLLGFALASMLGMPGQDPAVAVTFWLLVFWCAADAGVVKSAAGMRVTTWLAVLLVVAGYLSATVRAADLRPPFLASRFGWAYAYGFVFDGPASARSAQHGVTVQPAEGPWLKLTYWVEHPDADSNLVRVEIWRDHDRIVRRRMSAHVPATAYVSVSAGKRFVLETKVDRTFHTGDPNGDAGLSLKWEFVQNPPGSPTSVSATPALPPPHNPGA